MRGQATYPVMATLPETRLSEVPPFTDIGLDVFGPWHVTNRKTRGNSASTKWWAIVFTCLASRAVHFEVLPDMTTDSFINGLRRFQSIRGATRSITCDNGSNFVGAKNEFEKIEKKKVELFLAIQKCKWNFIPVESSYFGGVYEMKNWKRPTHYRRNVN